MTITEQRTQRILAAAAAGEGLTGLAALLAPAMVIGLLFGIDASGVPTLVARTLGTALMGLAAACWPRGLASVNLNQQRLAMLIYGASVSAVLAYGATTGTTGKLLWPAVALHLIVSILLGLTLLPTTRDDLGRRRT